MMPANVILCNKFVILYKSLRNFPYAVLWVLEVAGLKIIVLGYPANTAVTYLPL